MPETPDLEARVSALEKKVDLIAKDAAAARVLAGAADRDVSELRTELRGHTQVLNALRETQLEHGQRLGRVEGRLDSLETKVDDGFARVDQQFTKVGVGMAEITGLLTRALGEGKND